MGSYPIARYNYHEQNQHPPGVPRVVLVRKVAGKLGFKLQVKEGNNESFALITKVKPECSFISGSLHQLDRILKICDVDVTQLSEEKIFDLIKIINNDEVRLLVQRNPEHLAHARQLSEGIPQSAYKRRRDQVSCGSGSSNNQEAMKKVKDVMPRLIKSNSVDSDKKEPSESDALLNTDARLFETVDSGMTGVGMVNSEFTRATSLQEYDARPIIVEEEVYPSMPLHGCKDYLNNNSTLTNMVPLKIPGSPHFTGSLEDLFKFPHRVIWDTTTKAVTLHTTSQGKFGFSYKVKKNNVDDWYTLVTSVTSEGPADGKLMIGDYIRSIDGQALKNPAEALDLEKRLENLAEVKIVLQRPVGMLPKPQAKLMVHRQEPDSVSQQAVVMVPSPTTYNHDILGNVHLPGSYSPTKVKGTADYKRQASAVSQNSNSSKRSSGSGEGRSRFDAKKQSNAPVSKDSSLRTVGMFVVQPMPKQNSLDGDSVMDIRSDKCSQTRVEEVEIIVPNESKSAHFVEELQINQTIKLPKVRVFICGSEARQLAKLIFPENTLPEESCGYRLFDLVKLTMMMNRDKVVSFSQWSLYENLLHRVEKSRFHASNDSLDKLDLKESSISTPLHKGAINTEFYIVPDEKFFNHCCQYLFTRTSIFLLAFDGVKVFNSLDGEISRLQNMIHTIRCFIGYECPILTYGLLGGDQSELSNAVSMDEVRTLFYTSYGNQIHKYNVPGPSLFSTCPTEQECVEIRRSVWKAIGDTEEKQYVLRASVAMMHQLELRRQQGTVCITEEEFTQIFQDLLPSADVGSRQVVWSELKDFGEILSSNGAPLYVPQSKNLQNQLFIDPQILLTIVHHWHTISPRSGQVTDKHMFMKLVGSGNISHSDLVSITQCHNVSVDRLISLLQGFGLTFQYKTNNTEQRQYFVPCFLSDLMSSEIPRSESFEGCLYLQFLKPLHLSSMIFFQVCFGLDMHSETRDLDFPGANCCKFTCMGSDVVLVHQKLYDRIQILVNKRSGRMDKLYQLLHALLPEILGAEIRYTLGPACPLQSLDKCRVSHSQRNAGDVHVIDLAEGAPYMCGQEKFDNNKNIRMWVSKHISQPVVQQVPKNKETESNKSLISEEAPRLQMYIIDLPYTLFEQVFRYLQINGGRDWKQLAGNLGFTTEHILLFEQKPDPAKELLITLNQQRRLTIGKLIEELSEMERFDIVEKLNEWLATT
ncbi:hypothetical protein FSP39_013057 [Pinctada imbricata]|uniref:PDZ domain-containing protein n=1 Tax=Pinctada imbricata TaxID=66713 RepID=A0AA88YDD2_PINIB|nr:hypothetical protein FSP39_013057 [Pinctada imbricata]